MAAVIECDPGELVRRAGGWLEREPIVHNVVCTVVHRAIKHPSAFHHAHWFVVEDGGQPRGVAILTPPFSLTLTPMATSLLGVLADALTERVPSLPGVHGPGDVPLRFAELWQERTGASVERGMGQLMYRLDAVTRPPQAGGALRPAGADDRQLLCDWLQAFVSEAGAIAGDIPAAVDRRLAGGELFLWEDGERVTFAGIAPAVAGVVRVGPVYTPAEHRRRGYASNCVAAVSEHALDTGATACMLFTDEANPTSNAIYQRIGYRPVTTAAEYRFHYSGAPPG